MAIIEHGSLDGFTANAEVLGMKSVVGDVLTFLGIRKSPKEIQESPFRFPKSHTPRGFALKSLTLKENFEGLGNITNPDNEIYFISFCWDFSGQPPMIYPSVGINVKEAISNCIIPMEVDRTKTFGGSGCVLFPAQPVYAGLAIRLMLWESDQGQRDFGKTMGKVADAINKSELSKLLTTISAVTGPTGATITAAVEAAGVITGIISEILANNSDDYVDYFEGYYSNSDPWEAGPEKHEEHATDFVLNRLI